MNARQQTGLSSLKSPVLTSTLHLTAPEWEATGCTLDCGASSRLRVEGSCLQGGAPLLPFPCIPDGVLRRTLASCLSWEPAPMTAAYFSS